MERQRLETQTVASRLAAELAPVFASGRGQNDPLAYVEVLSGATRIAHRALALAGAANKSVNSCIKPPMILSKEQNWTFLKAPLGRSIKYRALCDAEAMQDAELAGWMTAWGAGAPFELLMTREFCDFVEQYDAEKDVVLSAHISGVLVGSISMVGRKPGPDGAQLRFFLVDPAYHGRDAGKALLSAALEWCRERGFRKIFLWTVDHLAQSRSLYEKAGFRVTERCPDDRYTILRDNLKMELTLQ